MRTRNICLLGGTGFVGLHLVSELARHGYAVRVLTRRRERHRDLLVFPSLRLLQVDVHDRTELSDAIEGCDCVINLAGILNEQGEDTFTRVHEDLPRNIVEACAERGIDRLIHMGALPSSPDGPSRYLKSKAAGEAIVRASAERGIRYTIFRPSVIFGPGDRFFGLFADLLRMTPVVFPLAGAEARFQPVYVGDVAEAIEAALAKRSTCDQTYDLCGPHTYTLRELVEYTMETTGLRRRIWPLSGTLAELQARVLEHLPGKPLTRDNLLSLQVDSVSNDNGLIKLGISPTGLDAVVPRYLGAENRTARNYLFRRAAHR